MIVPLRRVLVACGLVALGAALALTVAACGSNDQVVTTQPTETVTVATDTVETETVGTETETETAETETETVPAPGLRTVTIVVQNGRPRGGIARPTVKQGQRVRLRVRSDVAEEVHLHGYDISKDVAAGGTAVIVFAAIVAGRFEIELEQSGVQIAELTVEP